MPLTVSCPGQAQAEGPPLSAAAARLDKHLSSPPWAKCQGIGWDSCEGGHSGGICWEDCDTLGPLAGSWTHSGWAFFQPSNELVAGTEQGRWSRKEREGLKGRAAQHRPGDAWAGQEAWTGCTDTFAGHRPAQILKGVIGDQGPLLRDPRRIH